MWEEASTDRFGLQVLNDFLRKVHQRFIGHFSGDTDAVQGENQVKKFRKQPHVFTLLSELRQRAFRLCKMDRIGRSLQCSDQRNREDGHS